MSDVSTWMIVITVLVIFFIVDCYINFKKIVHPVKFSNSKCFDCRKPIHDDDDAMVCIQCGGMNRRIKK